MHLIKIAILLLPFGLSAQLECENPSSEAKGKCITNYSGGEIRIKGKIKNGERHGKFTTYFVTGQKESIVKYDGGKQSGVYRSFFMNGNLRKQFLYVDGVAHGDYIEYHDNGFIRAQGQVSESLRSGVWTFKDPHGNVIESVDYDKVEDEVSRKIDER